VRIVETITKYVVNPTPWITHEEIAELCCESQSMPECEEKTEAWGGFNTQEMLEKLGLDLDGQGRDGDGNYVDIRLIVPPSGVCGEKITKVERNALNCCDGVEPLEWLNTSVSVMSPGSNGYVFIDGGKRPLTVSIRGDGFYLDQDFDIRDAEIEGSSFLVYTTPTACGSAEVSITDGCTNTGNQIRCTVGQWVARDPVTCAEANLGIVDSDDQTGGFTNIARVVLGAFRYSQGWSVEGPSETPDGWPGVDISGCGTTIVPFPARVRYRSTYSGPQSLPHWFASNENDPVWGNNISCGWGAYMGRCETIGVEEWVC